MHCYSHYWEYNWSIYYLTETETVTCKAFQPSHFLFFSYVSDLGFMSGNLITHTNKWVLSVTIHTTILENQTYIAVWRIFENESFSCLPELVINFNLAMMASETLKHPALKSNTHFMPSIDVIRTHLSYIKKEKTQKTYHIYCTSSVLQSHSST